MVLLIAQVRRSDRSSVRARSTSAARSLLLLARNPSRPARGSWA
jgi:hypothetical protein